MHPESRDYAYLLGLYLGDACISPQPGVSAGSESRSPSGTPASFEARLVLFDSVRTGKAVIQRRHGENSVEVSAYWKCWPCLFPHMVLARGAGKGRSARGSGPVGPR